MLYEDLMLDASMKNRYGILRLLTTLNKGHYSIFFIAQKLNLTYQQAYHHLNELNHEIQQASPQQGSILIKNSGISTTKLVLSLDEYRYFLLQESVPFRFVQYIMNEPEPSLQYFCEEMFISRSTLSRKIKPLTEFLKKYGMRISYTSMSIVGDETTIRLTLFYLMWLGTRGLVWPFAFDQKELSYFQERFTKFFSMNSSYVGRQELLYFFAVAYARIRRHFYAPYNHKYDFLFHQSRYFDLNLLTDYPELPLGTAKGESAFLFFISLFAPYFTNNQDLVLETTLNEFAKNENIIWDFATQFITYIDQEIFEGTLRQGEQEVMLGNYLNITFGYYIFQRPFPTLPSFAESKSNQGLIALITEKIAPFFDDILAQPEYQPLLKQKEYLQTTFAHILNPYFNERQKGANLRVALAIEQNHMFMQQLHTFLASLTFVDFETYEDSNDDFDLIIGSSFLLHKKYPEIPFYYWDLDFHYEELIYLYQTLRRLYMKKMRPTVFLLAISKKT
ncbi:helix-turn-helix domain-containing protein [Enterococcus nangangensis]|uniref:helix-turn-helix domain-containing protein n=1 Tax=Enterococcus nangangensis TaxID=2559926 RepID=UPI0010F9B5F2|nr:helix-turn-helix domain-containing protein [Enterococcus nangangensis]